MPSSLFEILVALQPLIQYALKKSHLFPKATHWTQLCGALGLALIRVFPTFPGLKAKAGHMAGK